MSIDWTPILMYHAVARITSDPNNICVSPERFEAQMFYLKRRGLKGVSVRELREAATAEGARGLVGLTFDDGYQNFLQVALPVLERLGFSATVFVVGGMLGGENSWDQGPRMRLLDIQDIREISRRGMEVGSHGMSHTKLSGLDPDLLEHEVGASRRTLSEALGRTVEGFCFPYGSLDVEAVRAVRQAGYAYACAYRGHSLERPFSLPRIYVGEKDNAFRLDLKLKLHRHYTRIARTSK